MAFRLAAIFGSFTNKTIGKLVAGFAGVDVGRDHFGRACLVKRLNKFQRHRSRA